MIAWGGKLKVMKIKGGGRHTVCDRQICNGESPQEMYPFFYGHLVEQRLLLLLLSSLIHE